jgi:hypothetical protein
MNIQISLNALSFLLSSGAGTQNNFGDVLQYLLVKVHIFRLRNESQLILSSLGQTKNNLM